VNADLEHAEQLGTLLSTRSTQTNETRLSLGFARQPAARARWR